MKRLFILLFPVAIYSWLIVCISYSQTSEPDQIQATQIQTASLVPYLSSAQDNGKWPADENTTASIKRMQETMKGFTVGKNGGTVQVYQELGKTLNGEMKTLFRQCTMTGAAHDELHKFLIPIMKDVKVLQENDLKASKAAQMRLNEQLFRYQTIFE